MNKRPRIAMIHRYGLEGWLCCGGHAVPGIIKNLSRDHEIHFFGPASTEPADPELRALLHIHQLPYTWDRANPNDKITKTLLWYLSLPWVGLYSRWNGVKLLWNDETVPFTAPILRLFFGKKIALTVMDFFVRIYTEKHPRLHRFRNLCEWIDFRSWRHLSLLFTKVRYTQEFLLQHNVPQEIMHLYRNPVDHTKFHPVDAETRKAVRAQWKFSDEDIVLSHHGILHPNKGNDWILHRLADLKDELPQLKYLLVGNGPEMEPLCQLADQLQIRDRVVFTGWLPGEKELNEAIASADIGLVMRIGQETDHFHMTDTLAHEMACAKPILAVNLMGIREIMREGLNGYLFSPDKPDEFNQKMKQLALDPALRDRCSEAILADSITYCSIEPTAEAMAALIRNQIPQP